MDKLVAQGIKPVTAGELKQLLENVSDDTPIVIATDGGFAYVTEISPAVSSTWNVNRVWVVKDEDKNQVFDGGEFPLDESLQNGDMIPSVFLYGQKHLVYREH